MRKIEILTPPIVSKTNQGYAIYVEGKKVWESNNNFISSKGEEIKLDDLLHALGFKLHVVEVTDKVIDDNYGIFPDELDDLAKYSDDEKFQQNKLENEKIIPGDDFDFDSVYFADVDLAENDDLAYDYDFPDLESHEDINLTGLEDFFNEGDLDGWN